MHRWYDMLPIILLSVVCALTPTEAFAPRRSSLLIRNHNPCLDIIHGGDVRPTLGMVTRGDSSMEAQEVDLCIIGGGISGLAAAITTAEKESSLSTSKILLLESDTTHVGGRVRSDYTHDGYILDRGFAVFIEEYPQSKKMLDYDALQLKQFLPGAKVKLLGDNGSLLATVADPLRRPQDLFTALTSPVGSPLDKLRLLPLFYTVLTRDINELFAMDNYDDDDNDEEETDTLTCLRTKYKFSEEFISSFLAPFLEGIYLSPLEEQSSRMFHFVMKMFTVGLTSLPKGGMQAVSDQLGRKAEGLGVEVRLGSRAVSINTVIVGNDDGDGGGDSRGEYLVEVDSKGDGKRHAVRAKSIIVATDFNVTRNMLQNMDTGSNLEQRRTKPLPTLPQRSVGCIYYAFRSPAPLSDPILVLNGEGSQNGRRNTKDYPINNVCFPSVVQRNYAPDGYELCSVSILEKALSGHATTIGVGGDGGDDHASLDAAVRRQLSSWFPAFATDIMDESKWIRKGVYVVNNAQPAHYGKDGDDGSRCANVHGGRDCSTFQGEVMPVGLFVCGDHMATSTFNGALESGVNAGDAAGKFLSGL